MASLFYFSAHHVVSLPLQCTNLFLLGIYSFEAIAEANFQPAKVKERIRDGHSSHRLSTEDNILYCFDSIKVVNH